MHFTTLLITSSAFLSATYALPVPAPGNQLLSARLNAESDQLFTREIVDLFGRTERPVKGEPSTPNLRTPSSALSPPRDDPAPGETPLMLLEKNKKGEEPKKMEGGPASSSPKPGLEVPNNNSAGKSPGSLMDEQIALANKEREKRNQRQQSSQRGQTKRKPQ